MAEDKSNINLAQIKKLEKNIEGNLKSLYTDVKFADPSTSNTIEFMRNKMHRSIDKLMSNNISNSGVSNMSNLWTRTKNVQSDKSIISGIADTFENEALMNNVMSLYSQNSFLRDIDREIDVVCKYMPKLCDALDTRKEHVLSADHFSKTSINIKNSSSIESDVATASNIKEMREKYDIDELIDRVYTEADYKGECFVYIVPYKKAISRLLDPSKNNNGVLTEATNFDYDMKNQRLVTESVVDIERDTPDKGVTVVINKTGVLESAIVNHRKAEKIISENASLALNENGHILRKKMNEAKAKNKDIGEEINKNKEDFYKVDSISADGFTATDKIKGTGENDLKVPGCVVKILDHTMVKPLYIDDICLGYFYIECDKEINLDQTTLSNTLGGIKPGNRNNKNFFDQDDKENTMLKKIAGEISGHIDSKFINANQDLTKEIYFILKYNRDTGLDGKINKIKVSFIPPEDMVHAYFHKDHKTHRGISGLYKAMFPAKLFSCLYISNTLTILTRGQDKRIYYVKQSVDTNIASVLLSTINQIKKSNFGLRQIENMNNLFNITGKFNDLIIPKSPSGEAPVDVEVMPGQDVEVKTDLMNMLEEMAVNSTDVPLEVIQARQSLDFATHYTMSNSKFLRKVYNRQTKTKRISDKIVTKIYDAEFECEDIIDTTLPPPMYLNLVNTEQIFQSANTMAQNAMDMYAGNEDAEVQASFGRGVKKYYLSSFIPVDEFEKMLDAARMEAKLKAADQQ